MKQKDMMKLILGSVKGININTSCMRKPQSEIANFVYELANDRLKSSAEGYDELCKVFQIPKTQEGEDAFRRYKQSGSGLSNTVKYFEAQYHKEHYTEIPNFYDSDYDEG